MKMKCFFAILALAMWAISGEIRVQLMPEEARHLGACWIVQGKKCKSNESQILPAGNYEVNFTSIQGWKTPVPWQVEVAENGTSIISASYAKILPDDTQLWRSIDVYCGERHVRRLVIVAKETGNDGYDYNEEVTATRITQADAWLQRGERKLEWDECRLAPASHWNLFINNPGGDEQVTLKWNLWHVETDTSVILEKDGVPLCNMSETTSFAPEQTGLLEYRITLRQENLRAREYMLSSGWNAIGLDMKPGVQSMERLSAFKIFMLDDASRVWVPYKPSLQSRGAWIFTPRATALYLIGQACTPAPRVPGWSFTCVSEKCIRPAWIWNGEKYEQVDELLPGNAYWEYVP